MQTIHSINPATEEVVQTYQTHTGDEIEAILHKSYNTFRDWKTTSLHQRIELLLKLAGCLREQKEALAFLITLEMGKSILESRAEIEKCAVLCDYYAEHLPQFLQPEIIKTEASQSYVTQQPLGVVLAIMPWNFPFWQLFRCAVPAIAGGNTVILKHASNVPGCSIAIERVFLEAGFPSGTLQNVLLSGQKVSRLIEDRHIAAVSLTGSVETGKQVALLTGQLLKKTVLELGGSDPYLILEDADIEQAVELTVKSRMINAGQSCIGAKRVIVPQAIYPQVEALMIEKVKAITYGDPFDETLQMGPLSQRHLCKEAISQVAQTVKQGASLLAGGSMTIETGFFFPPTLLGDVKPKMTAYREEIFAPVISLIQAQDEFEAIRLANDTTFGLGAAIFSKDIQRAQLIAETQITCGAVAINDFVRSDARLPFGGIKESGYGRELSHHGIREFQNLKTITIK